MGSWSRSDDRACSAERGPLLINPVGGHWLQQLGLIKLFLMAAYHCIVSTHHDFCNQSHFRHLDYSQYFAILNNDIKNILVYKSLCLMK